MVSSVVWRRRRRPGPGRRARRPLETTLCRRRDEDAGVFGGLHRIDHCRQRFVVDLDQIERVFRLVAVGWRRRWRPVRRHSAPGRWRCRNTSSDWRSRRSDGSHRALHIGAGDDALTPGRASACVMSMPRMWACGWGERRIAACSVSGVTGRSSMNLPWPLSRGGFSRRRRAGRHISVGAASAHRRLFRLCLLTD